MASESDTLRVKRRSAKGKFTRQIRTVEALIANARSHSEVYINWEMLQRLYEDVQDRHEAFSETIGANDEESYEEEEKWIETCRETYVGVSMSVTDYIRNLKNDDNSKDSCIAKNDTAQERTKDAAEKMLETGAVPKLETGCKENSASTGCRNDIESRNSTFKLQFSQMPKFNGDVRDYAVFRSDFKDLIEPKCSKRDAVVLLRNSLSEKPCELIKGIGNDYTAAWEYLDSVYGDPRVVADAITYDITSFRALKEDEDSRFCELCHLVRRSFNTLKDIGRQADLDNNHILAIIEQKMCREDRKIWSRKVEEGNVPATLEQLLKWMTVEMKARMRASALIREERPAVSRVHYVSSREGNNGPRTYGPRTYGPRTYEPRTHGPRTYPEMSYRCWLCKSSTHWVDECEQFRSMAPCERLDMVNENNACSCCLKRTGRNHTANSCYRRRECMEGNGQEVCTQYHHPLLHVASQCHVSHASCDARSVGVAGMASHDVMLPVLDAYLLGVNNSHKLANVLLDSGAQISLIRTKLAEELLLSGEDVTITVNKVGGEEQILKTKRYQINIQSMDGKNTVTVNAIGIPYITEDISSITNFNDKARQLNIAATNIHRTGGPIDVLVGVDHPMLHTGETKVAGRVIARKSPLGWVIFGADGSTSRRNRVLNVQLRSKPVHWTDIETGATGPTYAPDEMKYVKLHETRLIGESYVTNGDQCLVQYPRKCKRKRVCEIPDMIGAIEQATEKKPAKSDDSALICHEQQRIKNEQFGVLLRHQENKVSLNVKCERIMCENPDRPTTASILVMSEIQKIDRFPGAHVNKNKNASNLKIIEKGSDSNFTSTLKLDDVDQLNVITCSQEKVNARKDVYGGRRVDELRAIWRSVLTCIVVLASMVLLACTWSESDYTVQSCHMINSKFTKSITSINTRRIVLHVDRSCGSSDWKQLVGIKVKKHIADRDEWECDNVLKLKERYADKEYGILGSDECMENVSTVDNNNCCGVSETMHMSYRPTHGYTLKCRRENTNRIDIRPIRRILKQSNGSRAHKHSHDSGNSCQKIGTCSCQLVRYTERSNCIFEYSRLSLASLSLTKRNHSRKYIGTQGHLKLNGSPDNAIVRQSSQYNTI